MLNAFKPARPLRKGARLFCTISIGIVGSLLLPISVANADCPDGSQFTVIEKKQGKVRLNPKLRMQSRAEGGYTAIVPLDLTEVEIDLSIRPSGHGIDTHFEVANDKATWRLMVPRSRDNDDLTVGDLDIEYEVTAANGSNGFLSSDIDPSSKVRINIIDKRVTRRVTNRGIYFKGFVNLSGDFAHATRSGGYSGDLVSKVNCDL